MSTRTVETDYIEAVQAVAALEERAAWLVLRCDPDDVSSRAASRACLRLADRLRLAWGIPRPTEAELDAAAEARWGLDDAPLANVEGVPA